MVPLKVGPGGLGPGGLGPGGLGPHKIDCEKNVDSQNPQCQQHFENCCDKNCKGKPDCKSDCMEKGQTHCTQGPALPKGCDCTGTDIGCCPRKNASNQCGDCNINGCQKENGMCVRGDPEPSPVQTGGCYIDDGECTQISPDNCDNPINKTVCAHNKCFDNSDCKPGPHSGPHSGPQNNPCGTIPLSWKGEQGKKFYDCLINNISSTPGATEEDINHFKCLLAYAVNNNISPNDVINGEFPNKQALNNCTQSNNKYEPPNFGSPSPSNFFDTTMGKVVILSIIILVILGIIGLTIFITEKKGKKK